MFTPAFQTANSRTNGTRYLSSLQALEASVYRKRIQDPRNDPIDHDARRIVAEEVEQWRRVQDHDKSDPILPIFAVVFQTKYQRNLCLVARKKKNKS